MKNKEKNKKIDEKSLQTLSCAIAVAGMILLLSGDFLISRFIRINPNQIYIEPKETAISNYDISFLNPVSLTEASAKIKEGGRVIIFSGRSTCNPCQNFIPILKETLNELNITDALYLERNTILEQSEEYNEFIKYSPILKEEFSSTPFLMIFQNGKWDDYILGLPKSEGLLKDNLKKKLEHENIV